MLSHSSKSFLYSQARRKYKELLVLAKRDCPIPPKAFLLLLRNPGHTQQPSIRRLKGGKKITDFQEMANLTATRELSGFLYCLPYTSQTGPCRNLQLGTANSHRQKNKHQEMLDIPSQRTRKGMTQKQKSFWYYLHYPNQPTENLHPLPDPMGSSNPHWQKQVLLGFPCRGTDAQYSNLPSCQVLAGLQQWGAKYLSLSGINHPEQGGANRV